MKPMYNPSNIDELATVVNVLKKSTAIGSAVNKETHYKYLTYFRADVCSFANSLMWYEIDQREYDLRTTEGEK